MNRSTQIRKIFIAAAKILNGFEDRCENGACKAIHIAACNLGFDNFAAVDACGHFEDAYRDYSPRKVRAYWLSGLKGRKELRLKALRALGSGHPERVRWVQHMIYLATPVAYRYDWS
jgi:hypothetical protein